jgi:hypothetical protein
MCVGSLLGAKPKPPPPLPEDATLLAQRKRAREEQQRQIAADKQKQFEMRVDAYTGKRGTRSLLSGRAGGQGYKLASNLMTKDTLGV